MTAPIQSSRAIVPAIMIVLVSPRTMETSTMADVAKDEVRRNYEAFVERLPELLQTHPGKFALMHDGKIVEFYDTAPDAYKIGIKDYGEGNFSIQEVTDTVGDLGFFSYAVHSAPV
jgi:hypothetical protein